MNNQNNRLDYIDKLRGFAILLVVLGHLYLPYTKEGALHPVAEMIYSFHMPLFFFISGYLCEITHKIDRNGSIAFIKKKSVALIVPYLFWLIGGNLIFFHGHIQSVEDLFELFCFFPNLHYWFMPVLFIMMILYLFQYKLINRHDTYQNRLIFMLAIMSCFCICGILFHQYFLLVYAIYIGSFFFGSLLNRFEEIMIFLKSDKVLGGSNGTLSYMVSLSFRHSWRSNAFYV